MDRFEEKVKEIEESRKVAEGSPENGGEKKADPQAEEKKPAETEGDKKPTEDGNKEPEGNKKPEGDKKPTEDGKKPEDKGGAQKPEPTEAEKQQQAFAKMRFENKQLKERIAKLEEAQKPKEQPNPEQPKTLADFNGDVGKYGEYLRETITKEVTDKLTQQFEEKGRQEKAASDVTNELRSRLENTFGTERTKSIWADMENPESMVSMIITDKAAEPIREAIRTSKRNADLLALMHAKPQIFQEMLELPEDRMKYRLYALEDAIEAQYSKMRQKQALDAQAEQRKKEQAAALPTPGAFGVNGNGTTDFSTLSASERVARYQEELKKERTR
jgi:hypothetical protein